MAGPIVFAAVTRALLAEVACPFCGHVRLVERKPAPRTCPRCRRPFPDPLEKRKR